MTTRPPLRILAIDPGGEQSAYLMLDCSLMGYPQNDKPDEFGVLPNEELLNLILSTSSFVSCGASEMAIEMIASYGMAVGREIFETCVWIGRFAQAWELSQAHRRTASGQTEPPRPWTKVYRADVKLHLCHSSRAKDPNVRQALIDRYGGKEKAVGCKKAPGPLYGVSTHSWAALGVAVTRADKARAEQRAAWDMEAVK